MLPSLTLNPKLHHLLGLPPSIPTSTILLVTGDNASGKSLFRRVLATYYQKQQLETITLSQQARSQSGLPRAVIYGDEEDEATGAISANALSKSFHQRTKPYVLIFDEPEIGMGEEAQLGAAIFLQQHCSNLPQNCEGIVLFTHSRILISSLKHMTHFIWLHHPNHSVNDWLNRTLLPILPSELVKKGKEKWHQINDYLKDKNENDNKNKR